MRDGGENILVVRNISVVENIQLLKIFQDQDPMLGSQMRLPGAGSGLGSGLPLPSPRHFLGGAGVPGVAGQDIETSIQNWRETFLNKYHEQSREVGGYNHSVFTQSTLFTLVNLTPSS